MEKSTSEKTTNGSSDGFKRKSSIVTAISLLYLFLTITNLVIFWMAIGSNQIRLISANALLASQATAFEVLRKIQPLQNDPEWQKQIRSAEPAQAILTARKRIGQKDKSGQSVLSTFEIISTSNRILYSNLPGKNKKNKLSPEDFRNVLQAIQARELRGQAFYGVPDVLSYRVILYIPLTNAGVQDVILRAPVSMASVQKELDSLVYLALSMVAIMLVVQGLFGFFIYNKFMKPVKQVAEGAVEVGKGNFDINIKLKNKDEIGLLAFLFNKMAASLKEKTLELISTIKELKKRKAELERDLEMAQNIQSDMLPSSTSSSFLQWSSFYQPLEKVSGDYYDVFHLSDGSVGIILADAMGHGVPAAFMTIMAKIHFSNFAYKSSDPSETMRVVNNEFSRLPLGSNYLTGFYLVVKPDLSVMYSSAGHLPAMLLRKDSSTIEEITTSGFFLGIEANTQMGLGETQLQPGDRLLIYTDGVSEAPDLEGNLYGTQTLEEFMVANRDLSPDEFKAQLVADVLSFMNGAKRKDDVTFIIIEAGADLSEQTEDEKALTLFRDNQYSTALPLITQLLEKEDCDARWKLLKAYCLVRTGSFNQAEEILEKESEIYRDDAELFLNLAICRLQRNDDEKAWSALKRVIEIRPDYGMAYRLMKKTSARLGKNAEFINYLRTGIRIYPENTELFSLLQNTRKGTE